MSDKFTVEIISPDKSILNSEANEVIIPSYEGQMGILKEHQGKKFGSLLLKHIIHEAFSKKIERLWVHTCSLDHKHALDNYLSKGFKTFKEETINFIF